MNIDKIKIDYYLNTNKKNLFELKHDSHFLKILGKNIDLINEIILDNILNDINAIIDFLYYIKNDEDKYNFLLIPSAAVTSTVTTLFPTFKSVLPTILTLDFSLFVIALTSILVALFGTFKV